MKLMTLAKAFSLMAVLQIVVYSCVCERFYTTFRLVENGSSLIQVFGTDSQRIVSQDGPDTVVADRVRVSFSIDTRHLEDITIASLSGLGNMAYASQPCDAEYYQAVDTILNIDITTKDSFGALLPGESILGLYGFTEERVKSLKREHLDGYGIGTRIDIMFPKTHGTGNFGMVATIETTQDTIVIETEPLYWR